MHISEGVLSAGILAAGWAVAGLGTAAGLRGMKPERIPRTALLSSAFFLASLVNIKIGLGSSHLSLIAPVGLILGWGAFPAILAALLLQALLFQFGGLLVLGVNVASMASAAVLTWLLFGRAVRRNGRWGALAAFAAGAFGVLFGALLVSLFLWASDEGFLTAAGVLFAVHVPVALVEGAVTVFLAAYLKRAAPEFLNG